eukprot:gene33591-49265_t
MEMAPIAPSGSDAVDVPEPAAAGYGPLSPIVIRPGNSRHVQEPEVEAGGTGCQAALEKLLADAVKLVDYLQRGVPFASGAGVGSALGE